MRAALALVLLSACAPDIVSGAYLCGPEGACPEDLACNGPDNICVLPGSAMPFACGATSEHEPNNSPTQVEELGQLPCASPLVQVKGCAPSDDSDDYFGFDVPPQCATPPSAIIRLAFPLAFEQMSLSIASAQATADQCDRNLMADAGDDQRCVVQPLVTGQHYIIHVARSGEGNCGGDCGFNRYTLSLQLGLP